jgi:hypothetical protein
MNRRKRLGKLSSIIYKLSSEADLYESSEDIFEKAEKELPFGISWIKKVWEDSEMVALPGAEDDGKKLYFSQALTSSFFESIFSSAKLDYSSEEHNERMLDEFISENWKFLYEMSNDEGLRKEGDLKLIGSGAFGLVYKIPSGNILKFADKGYHEFMLEDKFSRDDYGEIISEKQSDYIASNVGTKYLPKILDIYNLIIGDRNIYVTLMKEVIPLEKITEKASSSSSFNNHLFDINKIVFNTISINLKEIIDQIMDERKKINFNISHKKRFYIDEEIKRLENSLYKLSLSPMASTIASIGKDWDDLLESIEEAFRESSIDYISADETYKIKSIETLIDLLRSKHWNFIEGDIKKVCEDKLMNNGYGIRPFIGYVNSFMQKKLKEDWYEIFVKSFVHSIFRGNTDINFKNMGIDDRGYLVIFDG